MVPFYLGFLFLLVVLTFKTVLSECPNDWQADGVGFCYKQMKNTTDFLAWGYANAQCKALDSRGRLPVFKDAMSWNVFTMGVKQIKAQLMAQGTPPPGPQPANIVPIGAYKLAGEWYWLDGSKMAAGMNNWQTGEPNGTKDEPENCVGFYSLNGDTGYRDIHCNLSFGYVCQLDPYQTAGNMHNSESQDVLMSPPFEPCPAGWDTLGGVCYREPSVTPMIATPSDGTAACTKLNPKAQLPNFYNFQDYDNFIRHISFNVKADHENIALAFLKRSGTYVPAYGGNLFYTNWDQDEPSGQDCVFTNDINGYMWRAKACTEKGYIYCQIDTRSALSIKRISTMPPSYQGNRETTRSIGQPYVNMVNGSPVKNSGTESFHRPENGGPSDSSNVAVISSLDTFSKFLQQSYTEEETFGRSVAGQLKKFNPTLKADVMYQIQLVLSMKMKEIVKRN